jgi:hypothetical protein
MIKGENLNMSYSLWLDDIYGGPIDDDCNPVFDVWVKSYREFRNVLAEKGIPNMISLDHNLGFNYETAGMTALVYLLHLDRTENFLTPEYKLYFHSGDPTNRLKMQDEYKLHLADKFDLV